MLYHNELLFTTQIIIISIFLFIFLREKYTNVLISLVSHLFIFLNIFAIQETIVFSIHCSVIEPLGIALYFITIFLYRWNEKTVAIVFKNIYINHFFLFLIFSIINYYHNLVSEMHIALITNYFYNTFISIISFNASYYIEQHIFNILYTIESPFRESLSVSAGQLFDTIFYTCFVFYNRPLIVIFQIIIFSYIIKLCCIFMYTFFLSFKQHIK
jgi:hypothetical protein